VMGTGTRQAPGSSETPSLGTDQGRGAGMAANPHEARRPVFIQLAACAVMKRSEGWIELGP
jgi:hypothetical protein